MTSPSSGEDTPPTATQAVSGDVSTATQAVSDTKAEAQEPSTKQLQAIINDLRRENAAYRTQEEERETAKLSEIEKRDKRIADLEARDAAKTTRIASLAVEATARALGIIDPELAALAIQKDLKIGDDGLPENADALLKKLTQDKPYLLAPAGKPPVSSGGATNPARSAASGSNEIPPGEAGRRMISSFTESEYLSRQAEIQQWMARNPYRPGR